MGGRKATKGVEVKKLRRSTRLSSSTQPSVDPSGADGEDSSQMNHDSNGGGRRTMEVIVPGLSKETKRGSANHGARSKRSRGESLTKEELNPGCSAETSKRRRTHSTSLRRSSRLTRSNQETNHSMVCSPFDSSKYTIGIAVHDIPNQGDVLQVPDYVADIYQRLFRLEVRGANLVNDARISNHFVLSPMLPIFLWLNRPCLAFILTCINNPNLTLLCG
jgi:hypothetical protein